MANAFLNQLNQFNTFLERERSYIENEDRKERIKDTVNFAVNAFEGASDTQGVMSAYNKALSYASEGEGSLEALSTIQGLMQTKLTGNDALKQERITDQVNRVFGGGEGAAQIHSAISSTLSNQPEWDVDKGVVMNKVVSNIYNYGEDGQVNTKSDMIYETPGGPTEEQKLKNYEARLKIQSKYASKKDAVTPNMVFNVRNDALKYKAKVIASQEDDLAGTIMGKMGLSKKDQEKFKLANKGQVLSALRASSYFEDKLSETDQETFMALENKIAKSQEDLTLEYEQIVKDVMGGYQGGMSIQTDSPDKAIKENQSTRESKMRVKNSFIEYVGQ